MLDPVPYFTQSPGAQHSPEVFRAALFTATRGAEGIVGVGDLKVVATPVPNGNVVVSIGAALLLSRDVGGAQQTYEARNPSADPTVKIAQTGSSGKRSDLVILRVEDPGMDGTTWPDPVDVGKGPFVFFRVISGVPAGTTRVQDVPGHENDTAITLARVDIPASTATITSAMIVDLRTVALPRKDRQVNAHAQVQAESEALVAKTSAGEVFPNTSSAFTVLVPPWATQVIIIATWSQVQAGADANGSAYGRLWVQLGADSDANKKLTQESSWDTVDVKSGKARYTYTVVDTVYVPAGLRGRRIPITMRGRRSDTTATAETLVLDAVSGVAVDAEFVEVAA